MDMDRLQDDCRHLSDLEELGSLLSVSSRDALACDVDDISPLLEHARHVQAMRHAQRRLFPASLFRESSWDIILNCFIAQLEARHLCVKQLHSELDESNTAMLRRLADLELLGLILRSRDELDGRRTLVRLTPLADGLIRQFLKSYAAGPM